MGVHTPLSPPPQDRPTVNTCRNDKYEQREEGEAVEENRESLFCRVVRGGVSEENLREEKKQVPGKALEIKSQAGGGGRA